MDNASFHRSNAMEQICAEDGVGLLFAAIPSGVFAEVKRRTLRRTLRRAPEVSCDFC